MASRLTIPEIVKLIELADEEGWVGEQASEQFLEVYEDDPIKTTKALEYVQEQREAAIKEGGQEGGDEKTLRAHVNAGRNVIAR